MVAGLYYDISVDYSTQMWKEFQKSVENTNVVQGILCARYWSLILGYFYEKEGIYVPADEEKAEFLKYHFLKEVSDDMEIFTHIARIPDAMLKRVDPTNSVLIEYLKTINPDVETGKLLSKEEAGPSKKSKRSKKDAKVTREKIVYETKKASEKIVHESKKS